MNNAGTEIASMSLVTSGQIKGKDNISADSILHVRSIQLFDPLDLEGEGEFGYVIFFKNCSHRDKGK